MASLKELRTEAKERYSRGQGQKSLKGYGAMSKAALMAKLGKSNEEKRDNRAMASSKTANAIASKLVDGQEGDTAVKRVQAKARLLRAVKRDIDAARKVNPDISQEDLRKVAGKAFLNEAKAIKEGKAEVRTKKGGQKPKAAPESNPVQPETSTPKTDKKGQGLLFDVGGYIEPSPRQKQVAKVAAAAIKRKIDGLKEEITSETGGKDGRDRVSRTYAERDIAERQEKIRNLQAMYKKQVDIAAGKKGIDKAYKGTELEPEEKRVGKITTDRVTKQFEKVKKSLKRVENQAIRHEDKKSQAEWDAMEPKRQEQALRDKLEREEREREEKRKVAEVEAKYKAEKQRQQEIAQKAQSRKDNYPAYSKHLDSVASDLKGTSGTVKVKSIVRDGWGGPPVDKFQDVSGTLYGDIALHKTVRGKGYSITHVPSGMSINRSVFPSQAEGKRAVASILLSGGDYSKEQIDQGSLKKLRQAMEGAQKQVGEVAPEHFDPSNPPQLPAQFRKATKTRKKSA